MDYTPVTDICQRYIRIKFYSSSNFIHFASVFRYFYPLVGNFHQIPCTTQVRSSGIYAFIRIFIAFSPNTSPVFYFIIQFAGISKIIMHNTAPFCPISGFAQIIIGFAEFCAPQLTPPKMLCKMPLSCFCWFLLCIFMQIFYIKKNLPETGGSDILH